MPQMAALDFSDRHASFGGSKAPLAETDAAALREGFRPMLKQVRRKPDLQRKPQTVCNPLNVALMLKMPMLKRLCISNQFVPCRRKMRHGIFDGAKRGPAIGG